MPTFQAISEFFPVILAPGVVALARGRWPGVHRAVDGLLVWLAVVGAAVLWALVLGAAHGEPVGYEMVRRGFVLGLVSACAHTLVRKPKAEEPAPAEVPAAPVTPETSGVHAQPVVEESIAWGPRPSGT